MGSARRFSFAFLLSGTLALTFGLRTTAYAMPSCVSRSTVLPATFSGWAAPLDRSITVTTPEISLRAAIDRVAAESRLQFSYSADLIPADRRVCLNVERMSTGSVIDELLRGTSLRAIVLDANNVALTPTRGPAATDPSPPAMMAGVGQLDRVVVTGTADAAKSRSSSFALDVIDRSQLARRDASTLVSAFDGAVPGLWMWSQAPSNMVSRFGSVRGASSFGVTTPKMYIDGIEVANPLVFTQFDPDRIDRIEVIRGPQGAALYGADAISGVVNIITRHDGGSDSQSSAVFRTRAGLSTSAFSNGSFVQDHSIGLRAGNAHKSIGLGADIGTVGNYIPGGSARSFLADADGRLVGSSTVFTGTARFALKQAGTLTSPVLAGIASSSGGQYAPMASTAVTSSAVELSPSNDSAFGEKPRRTADAQQQYVPATYGSTATDSNAKQSLEQYTLGTTGTWASSPTWTHTLVAGVDGYRMNGVNMSGIPMPVERNSLDGLTHSEADRTTLALRSTARMGSEDGIATSFILGAEHTATREEIEARSQVATSDLSLAAIPGVQTLSYWTNTGGVLSQVNSSFWNSLFLSAGGRVEYSSGAASASRVSLLPMLGASFVRERDGQTLKFRAAYGKGIRPSNSVARAVTWMGGQTSSSVRGSNSHLDLESLRNLEPEAQAGTEIGADVLFGRQLGLHITRFDQRATGLIQAVALPGATRIIDRGYDQNITYRLQNVGAITNRGWELQATSSLGRFSLQGSASFVDSRVERVAMGYGGELRAGDRMLEVPAKTFGLTGGYTSPRWTTSWSLSRAMDWINYDQLAIAEKQNTTSLDSKAITGIYLRNFWRDYNGANRLGASFSYSLRHGLSLVMTGDNLLNLQRGEPDNVTVIPGRTLTAGFRTRF